MRVASFVLLAVVGCGGGDERSFAPSDGGADLRCGDLPEVVDFGVVPGGAEASVALVTEGCAVTLTDTFDAFRRTASKLAFTPRHVGLHVAELAVDDRVVRLRGEGVAPSLFVRERTDAGAVAVGCAAAAPELSLVNDTDFAIAIEAVSVSPSDGWRASTPARIIEGHGALPVRVVFSPQRIGEATAELSVLPARFVPSSLGVVEGRGVERERVIDEHRVPMPPPLDVLFVIDVDPIARPTVDANVLASFEYLGVSQSEARVALTTADPTQERFVVDVHAEDWRASTEAALDRIAERADDPRPLETALRAAQDSELRRVGARLQIVFVSDRDDRSTASIDDYIDALRPEQPGGLTVQAIVGVSPTGCEGPGASAQPAPRLVAVAEVYGYTGSVCDLDWSRVLEDLSTAGFTRLRLPLSRAPLASTIAVAVDGVDLPAVLTAGTVNWVYDDARRDVVFAPYATPRQGQAVDITYRAACPIDGTR